MNKATASSAIQRLITLGLIEAKIAKRKRSSYRIRSIPELMNCALIPDRQKHRLSGLRGHKLSGSRGHKVHHQGATPEGLRALAAFRKHCPV